MSCVSRLRSVAVAMLLVAACSDTPTTPVDVTGDGPRSVLEFDFPAFRPDMLVQESREIFDGSQAGTPARATAEGEQLPPLGEELEIPSDVVSDIWNARTGAGIGPTEAWAEGSHQYQGNKSRIETTLRVTRAGAEVGRQTGIKQADWIFWFDFGIPKSLSVLVRYYVNAACGFAAWASSQHDAWWEAIPGASIATYGRVARFSQSDYNTQPECPEPPPSVTFGLYNDYGGGYCWVSIWYDIWTGEVIHLDVLYCE